MVLESPLFKLLIVEGAKLRRHSPESPDQSELRGDEVNDQSEPRLLRKREARLGFALRLGERVARRQKVGIQMVAAEARVSEVAGLVRRLERAMDQAPASLDMLGPGQD